MKIKLYTWYRIEQNAPDIFNVYNYTENCIIFIIERKEFRYI